MKIKLVILFCFTPLILWCQNQYDFTIQKEIAHYSVELKKDTFTTYSTVVYTIYNTSDSLIWLWFEKNDKLSEERKLKEYFFKTKGNLSLFHVLTDANIVFSNDFHPSLFYGFLKVINPQDSFSIHVTFTGEEPEKKIEDIYNYLEKHLVLVSDEKLKKHVGLPNIEHLNQAVFYKNNFIALPTELIDLKNNEKK